MKTVAHEGPESETSPHLAWKLYAAPSSRIASMCGVSDHRSASGRQPSIRRFFAVEPDAQTKMKPFHSMSINM